MKTIKLTKGYFALVDDSDYESLACFKWHIATRTRKDGVVACVYACRKSLISECPKRRTIYMHRQILGVQFSRKPDVDHRDTNGLNNQRGNLRVSTRSGNLANARIRIDNKSSRKGVHWDKKNRKWVSSITVKGKYKFLGRFSTLEAASAAHDKASVRFFGEFHRDSATLSAMNVGD